MTRNQLVKQLADIATRPVGTDASPENRCMDAEISDAGISILSAQRAAPSVVDFSPLELAPTELFVWFEDTAARALEGRRGVAGLPECLLPAHRCARIIERRYATDHLHLLSAVRITCRENAAEMIAALYTAALSVGTVAWIGTGKQYARTWVDMYGEAPAGS